MANLRSAPGGGNRLDIFALGTNAFGTLDTHVYDNTASIKVTGHPLKKKVVVDIDSIVSDAAFMTHLNTYLTDKDMSAVEFNCEDGTMLTSSTLESGKYFGFRIYFAQLSGTTYRKAFTGVGVYTGPTGDLQTGNKAFEKTPAQITVVPAPATYTVAAALWDTGLTTGGATITIAQNSYGTWGTVSVA